MAVRIEAIAFGDERFDDLAHHAGLADADHARGKMARLWRQCTLEGTHELGNQMVFRVLGPCGVDALIKSRLGELVSPDRIRIKGTKGRIEWLDNLRTNGRKGGRPKKITGVGNVDEKPDGFPANNQMGNQERNPLALVTSPSLALVTSRSKTPIAPKGRAKPRPTDPTPAELESVRVVLAKLGAQNGVAYTGSGEHTRLITARLREGSSEMDLRKVIQYCAQYLEWRSDDKMRAYLRPETLFGPKTIAKYLDAARAWFAQAERSNAQ